MTTSPTDFASLSLPAHVLAKMTQHGYTQMTPIQAASLPLCGAGDGALPDAQTGRPGCD